MTIVRHELELTNSYLGVTDLLLDLGDKGLKIRHLLLGSLIFDLLQIGNPRLENVDGVLQALHGLVILSVEALCYPQLVVSLGNNPGVLGELALFLKVNEKKNIDEVIDLDSDEDFCFIYILSVLFLTMSV